MSVDTGKELFRIGFLTAIEIPDRGYVGGLLVTNHFGRPLEFQCTAPLKPNRTQEILYGHTLVPYVLGDLIGRTLIEKVGVKPHIVLTERPDLLDLRELVTIAVACVDDGPGLAPTGAEDTAESKRLSGGTQDNTGTATEMASESLAVVGTPITVETPISPVTSETAAEDTGEPQRLTSGTQTGGTQNGAKQNGVKQAAGKSSTMQLGRQLLRFHAAHAEDREVANRGAQLVPNNADLREPFERVREALGETARAGGSR
jgi:hypothetical protein